MLSYFACFPFGLNQHSALGNATVVASVATQVGFQREKREELAGRKNFNIPILEKRCESLLSSRWSFTGIAALLTYIRLQTVDFTTVFPTMVGENRRLVHYQQMISPHGRSKFPTIRWQSDCNFNPPGISRWTIKMSWNYS